MTPDASDLGIIPSDWSSRSLAEVLREMRNGSTATQNTEGRGVPVTRIETISAGRVDYDKVRHVDPSDGTPYRLETGDILFSHINSVAHIGKVARYDGSKPLYHGMNLMLLRFDPSQVNPLFGFLCLASQQSKGFFEARCKKAINQASLNRGDIGSFRVPIPPLLEQRKIAAILSSVDDAIESTQAVIDQLGVVKKAMMAELLTRGLPGQHTRFKMTEIGEVPVEWEVRPTGDVLTKLAVGVRYDKRTVVEEGSIPVLDQSQNQVLGFHDDQAGILASPVEPVVTFANHTCAVRWMIRPFSVIQNVFPLRGARGVQTRFLHYVLKTRLSPSGYKGHWPELMETHAPVPAESEQREIARVLDSIDFRLVAEAESLDVTRNFKTTLMSILLTGEIRVSPDEAA